MRDFLYWTWVVVLVGLFLVGSLAAGALIFMALWNISMPVFGLPTLSFIQSFGLWGLLVLVTMTARGLRAKISK
jgi:hypothetical protein